MHVLNYNNKLCWYYYECSLLILTLL